MTAWAILIAEPHGSREIRRAAPDGERHRNNSAGAFVENILTQN